MNIDMRAIGQTLKLKASSAWVSVCTSLVTFRSKLKPFSTGDLKKDAAIWSAFQKAFAAVAAMPAIVSVTKALLKQQITGLGFAVICGISFFAALSVVATSRGLRSDLLCEGYPPKRAEACCWLLFIGAALALAGAIFLPINPQEALAS